MGRGQDAETAHIMPLDQEGQVKDAGFHSLALTLVLSNKSIINT